MEYKNISQEDKSMKDLDRINDVFDLNRPMTPEEMEHHHWLLEMENET